jgi:S1-C subfamily serine protease
MLTFWLSILRSLAMLAFFVASGAGLFFPLDRGAAGPTTPSAPPGPLNDEPILGLQFETAATGAVVRGLEAGGLAERSGLRVGDLIRRVNGLPVDAHHALDAVLITAHVQGLITLNILRQDSELTIEIDLTRLGGDVQS